VGIVTLLYILMAAALVLMVPSSGMPPEGASFAAAFQAVGLGWVQYVVAAGACLGIITSVLVSGLGRGKPNRGVEKSS
jgi:amino acid transporter